MFLNRSESLLRARFYQDPGWFYGVSTVGACPHYDRNGPEMRIFRDFYRAETGPCFGLGPSAWHQNTPGGLDLLHVFSFTATIFVFAALSMLISLFQFGLAIIFFYFIVSGQTLKVAHYHHPVVWSDSLPSQ